MKKITLRTINALNPCFNPKEIVFTEDLELTPLEFIEQFSDKVKEKEDIIWLLCRKQYMHERDMRLFAVWCARNALSLINNPDKRSINAIIISEKYANGEASKEELTAAADAARAAQIDKLKEYFEIGKFVM